jgi:hypothetical protein
MTITLTASMLWWLIPTIPSLIWLIWANWPRKDIGFLEGLFVGVESLILLIPVGIIWVIFLAVKLYLK